MRKTALWLAGFVMLAVSPALAQEVDEVTHHGNPNSFLSNIVVVDDMIYLSGVLGDGETVQEQTRDIMETIQANLATVGATMDNVVKCTVYMADLSQRPQLNEVYRSYFPNTKPARSAVGVDLGGPLVEIECMAALPS